MWNMKKGSKDFWKVKRKHGECKNRILNERSHDAVVLRLCVLKKLYVSEFFLTIATHLEAYKQSRIRLPA